MTKFKLILLFLFVVNSSFSQLFIKKVDFTGKSEDINIDSIITIPKEVYDSIIISKLTVPQNIEYVSNCYQCSGVSYAGFVSLNHKLVETKSVRSPFEEYPQFDSILIIQAKIVYDNLEKYAAFEKDKFYFIIIAIKFEFIDSNDNKTKTIEKIKNLGGRYYNLQKNINNIFFKTDEIPFTLIPKNIDECLAQLDSVLTDDTKNNIKTWNYDYYDYQTRNKFWYWIRYNWKILCGCDIATISFPPIKKVALEKYFEDLGITESCYIMRIVIDCYYKHLKGLPINFNDEIANYIEKQKQGKH